MSTDSSADVIYTSAECVVSLGRHFRAVEDA